MLLYYIIYHYELQYERIIDFTLQSKVWNNSFFPLSSQKEVSYAHQGYYCQLKLKSLKMLLKII